MSNQLNFEFDVRIPLALVDQMMNGEIACAMYVTMTILYRWSNWRTGRVKRVCASSLELASNHAFSERTFSEALRKLEWMRWITRETTPGSHKWYPVVIHNYKWTDDAGKVHILNPTEIRVYEKFPEGRCDEASWDASDETSDRHYSLHESENDSENYFDNESENNNGVVVSETKTQKVEPPSALIAGYTPEQIEAHVKLCKLNPWVQANDSPAARQREAFVRHLMTIEPPRRVISGHAAINPELHTGLDAQGKSWVGVRCRVCDISRTDNPDSICDSCRKR